MRLSCIKFVFQVQKKGINMDILDNRFRSASAAHELAHPFFCSWGGTDSRTGLLIMKLFFALLILLLISRCAMATDPESETQETKAASTTLSEKQTDMANLSHPRNSI